MGWSWSIEAVDHSDERRERRASSAVTPAPLCSSPRDGAAEVVVPGQDDAAAWVQLPDGTSSTPMMLPSLPQNHAARPIPGRAAISPSHSTPGMSYPSNVTPLALRSPPSDCSAGTCHCAIVCPACPAYAVR